MDYKTVITKGNNEPIGDSGFAGAICIESSWSLFGVIISDNFKIKFGVKLLNL